MKQLYQQIAGLGNEYQADKIFLFGSRARGDNRERSDIDLAVYGMPEKNQSAFSFAVEDLPTLLDFDIVFVSDDTSPELLKNIEKDGIAIMDKMQEKYGKLQDAVARLGESLEEYKMISNTTMRDGVIQRFEFCTELSWKTIREYLLDQGYTDVNSPKSVMKKAFADGLLQEEGAWIDLLAARNSTSHIYDEKTAAKIFQEISTQYYPMFLSLIDTLRKK